mmetsp:Transcript_45582/g.101967  ORF Transcript_45582/g.101967 Transcript_45582/m.101967 type:complete len:445 (-) Transcript_45582:156-1490(-)
MGDLRSERGCVPCCNCLVSVPQDRYVAVEYFGSYSQTLRPGLNWTGFDLCGLCVAMRSISSRTQQLESKVTTKTKDNVFCTVHIAVQFAVNPQSCEDAIYKLANVTEQVDAYVADIVRSRVPTLDLDDVFEAKDSLSSAISEQLTAAMATYGFTINNVLCTQIRLHQSVMDAMNEINRQKRLREAAIMQAEADKIRLVKAAEAQADAAELQGDGLARQRGAIIDGLRTAVLERTGGHATTEELSKLLIISQYFETVRDIGCRKNSKTFFMPKADADDAETQLRYGWLQAKAGLEGIRGPKQQTMDPPPRREPLVSGAPKAKPTQQRRGGSQPPKQAAAPPSSMPRANSALLEEQRRMAEVSAPARSSPPPRTFSPERAPSPMPQQPPPAPVPQPVRRQPVILQIQVPMGVGPGSTLQAQAPDGRVVRITVPPGVAPGTMLQVQV